MGSAMRAFAAVVVMCCVAGPAGAQQMVRPEPLDPDGQVARQVASFMEVLLRGDVDAALAYGRDHAAETYRDGSMSADIRAAMAAMAAGSYRYAGAAAGRGGDVLVPLESEGGEARLIFILEVEEQAPHRIRGIRRPGLRTAPAPIPADAGTAVEPHRSMHSPGKALRK